MNIFCSLVVSKPDVSNEELKSLEEKGYEVWEYEEEVFIGSTILYSDDEEDTDVVSFDQIQITAAKMASDLDVCISDIDVCMSVDKGE